MSGRLAGGLNKYKRDGRGRVETGWWGEGGGVEVIIAAAYFGPPFGVWIDCCCVEHPLCTDSVGEHQIRFSGFIDSCSGRQWTRCLQVREMGCWSTLLATNTVAVIWCQTDHKTRAWVTARQNLAQFVVFGNLWTRSKIRENQLYRNAG